MAPKQISGSGGKSGGASGGISEAADNLSSTLTARFVDLIGEGEIVGLVNAEKSIYLDGVALRSLENTPNYRAFRWNDRKGTQSQTEMDGFSGTQSEFAVGLQLTKAGGPIIRTVADADADAARVLLSVNGLSETTNKGKIVETEVEFKIRKRRTAASWVDVIVSKISGKTTSKYQRSIEIPLSDLGAGPYEISVERVTNDSASGLLVNNLFWDSYTVVNYEKFTYPNSALIGVEIDARYFNSIPERKYHVRGLLVRVPKNYDPLTRQYATTGPGTSNGAWDGTFKIAYTDNPAWCYYDLLTSSRYGLGKLVSETQVDKWSLYEIGQYCDELVPTGLTNNVFGSSARPNASVGGQANVGVGIQTNNLEPRFRLNCVLNTPEQAYKVLNQLTSVFWGMSYWGGVGVTLTQDRPTTPSHLYTNANVRDGIFMYEGSGLKQRNTVCVVAWNDPSEDFRQKYEYVEDREGISRYGLKSTEIIAFGCTSRSQARRLGLWTLYTQKLQREVIRFAVGFDSAFVAPGDVVKIADADFAGVRWGGRLVSGSTSAIVLDRGIDLPANVIHTFSVMMPDGTVLTRNMQWASAATRTNIPMIPALPQAPLAGAIWTASSSNLTERLARVVAVKQDGDFFEITAVEHNPSKYAAIEQGVGYEEFNYSVISFSSVPKVQNLTLVESSYDVAPGRGFVATLQASWDSLQDPTVRGFLVRFVGADGSTHFAPESSAPVAVMEGAEPQQYTVYVRAVNSLGIPGEEVSQTYTVLGIDDRTPPAPTGLTISMSFSNYILGWGAQSYLEGGGPSSVEVWTNTTNNSGTATLAGMTEGNRFVYAGAPGVQRFFWFKSVAKNNKRSSFSSAVSGTTGGVDWSLVSGSGKPQDGATVGAPAGTLINGVSVESVTTAVTNFNAGNDRNGAAVTAPTILTDGTAVDHAIQADGSADISFEWGWAGSEGDIDGFQVFVRQATTSGVYTFGTSPAEETVYEVPASKRAFILYGTAANRWYTWGVRAYRRVDKDVAASGVILSTLVKATGSGENPYRPSSTVAFTGNVTGTIDGTAASTVRQNAATALADSAAALVDAATAQDAADAAALLASAAQSDATAALASLSDISSDSKLTASEKLAVRVEWDAAFAERSGIRASADLFLITTEKTAYDNALQALGTYLNGGTAYTIGSAPPLWITDAQLSNTTDISGSVFRTNWANFYAARQVLLDRVSFEASKRASWDGVTGSGKPADFATNGPTIGPTRFTRLSDWTNAASGSPESAPDFGQGTLVTGDADFGDCIEVTGWTSGGTLAAKSVVPALAGRVYRVTVRYKVVSSDGSVVMGVQAMGLTSSFASTATVRTVSTETVTTTGVRTYTRMFSDTAAAGVDAWPAGAAYLRLGLRMNSTESGLVVRVGSIIIEDVTEAYGASVAAAAAATAATNAQNSANAANTAIADISSDGKLTPVEKIRIRQEWDAVYSERAGIRAQADSFSITTEKTAYDNDFQTLGTYLNGGTAYTIGATPPLWITDAQLSVTTNIVQATFRTNWSNLYTDRQALLNRIASEAALRAAWANVSGPGRPSDYAGTPDANLLVDPLFTEQAAGRSTAWQLPTGGSITSSQGENGTAGLRIDAGGSVRDAMNLPFLPMLLGEVLYVTARVYVSSTLNGAANIALTCYQSNRSTVTTYPGNVDLAALPRDSWQTITGSITVTGALTTLGRFRVSVRDSATAGHVIVSDVYLGRVQRGATVGAQAGVNLLDSAGATLGDLAFLNKYSNGPQLAGDLSGNPFMTRVDAEYDRPLGLKAGYQTSAPGVVAYSDSTRSVASIGANGDTTVGAAWPAFRVQPNMRYRAFVRWRVVGGTAGGAGLYFRFLSKNTEIAQGCTHIGVSPVESGVDPGGATGGNTAAIISDTNGATGFYENKTLTAVGTWYETVLEYTPGASVRWASLSALKWSGQPDTSRMEIDTCFIYPVTTAADGATVGAPSGTPVAGTFPGGSTAADVESKTNLTAAQIAQGGTVSGVDYDVGATGLKQVTFTFLADGRIGVLPDGGSTTYPKNWHAPTTAGVGTGKYLRIIRTGEIVSGSGSGYSFTAATAFSQLNSSRTLVIGKTFTTAGSAEVKARYEIYDGTSEASNLLYSGNIDCTIGYEP